MKTRVNSLWFSPLLVAFGLAILAVIVAACAQQTGTPDEAIVEQTGTSPPLEAVQPTEPPVASTVAVLDSPVPTPVSPLPTPTPGPTPTLPPELTGPLVEFTVYNGIRADFVRLPFYRLATWTGMAWDGDRYIWVVNSELQAIAGFNIEKSISDRLVPFPADQPVAPQITGIAWDGSTLWLSDLANERINRIELATGKVEQGFAYDGTPNGLAWAGDGLWVLSKDRLAVEKVSLDGERLLSFPVRGTWPTGLAWDGRYFWYSDGQEATISILNPLSGKSKQLDEIKFMANPGTYNGLAWMPGYLWVATEGDERLHRFDVTQLDWETLEMTLQ